MIPKTEIIQKAERIAKVIAAAGFCSRRQAEQYIKNGQVKVDGITIDTPALRVTKTQKIIVNNISITQESTLKTRLWCYYKPLGMLTTHNDPQGRPTVFKALPLNLPRVISVGRLDINSEGLLLLTNDGALARAFELPKNALQRFYRVRVWGNVDDQKLQQLQQGITIQGIKYASIKAFVEKRQTSNTWLIFQLTEGKNREIRRICEHFHWSVNRLIRFQYGLFDLRGLKPGELREIPSFLIDKQKALCASLVDL